MLQKQQQHLIYFQALENIPGFAIWHCSLLYTECTVPRSQNFDRNNDNMLFTLSTDQRFSLLTEHTESRRLQLADSWPPKSWFLFKRMDGHLAWQHKKTDMEKFNRHELGKNTTLKDDKKTPNS